jgi:aminoacyl tRNA synthase complex-interacting multifunctional protein 1
MPSTLQQLDALIGSLESSLNLLPGEEVSSSSSTPSSLSAIAQLDGLIAGLERSGADALPPAPVAEKKKKEKAAPPPAAAAPADDLPAICQIEFKVGRIVKVWPHPDADKLWCEEIDVGESEPRQICSGLRPYYDEAGMLGRRLLVVANLKAKNLKGFKSHGMVLCASEGSDDNRRVQFVEPPEGATLGEVVQFEGLPTVVPASGAQVEKKKMFEEAAKGMKTNDKFEGTWEGHVFMTSAGPCKCVDIAGGEMH